jgi:hypothetical protein
MAAPNNHNEMLYPLEHMSEKAASILANASYMQQQHDIQWAALQSFIQNNFTPDIRDMLTKLLQPYARHLRTSLDWQIDLAMVIFSAVDAMSSADKDAANTCDSDATLNHHHYPGFP